MITLGKRQRDPPYSKHYYPSGPGVMPGVSNRPSGPSAPPPIGSQIAVQSRSTVVYSEVNPTASIPLMIRPWSEHYEKDYAPGCLIFTKQKKLGRSSLITVADLPTLNYLFTQGRSMVNGQDVGDEGDRINPDDFEFYGLFRNDAGKQVDHLGFPRYTNPQQRLIQCDVYGRAKAANFWGNKLRTGQRVGIALVVQKIAMTQEPNKHSRSLPAEMITFQLLPTVNDCLPGTDTPVTRYNDQRRIGLRDGTIAPDAQDVYDPDVANAGYIRHWDIGVVSQAAYEPPTKANIALAKHSSQQRTHLPQIEVLMI